MHRSAAATLALLLAAAGCSSSSHTATPSASATPPPTISTTSTAGQLTENSTCADYRQQDNEEQLRFLNAEVISHIPQNRPSITIPAFTGGSPSIGNGNVAADTQLVVFLQLSLEHTCAQDASARLGDLLAPAWTSSPSP